MRRTSSTLRGPRIAFIPALRHEALTPAYDFLIRLTMPEVRFKEELIDAAAIDTGQRALDVGCGTGTLLSMIAKRHPDALLAGVDPDPRVLQRAQRKIAQSGHSVALRQGSATALPYAAESFDLVVSSLVFHHLTCGEKLQAMREIHRILAPGGELHLGDFGEPDTRVMRVVSFLTEKIGREHVADNFAGMLADARSRGVHDGRGNRPVHEHLRRAADNPRLQGTHVPIAGEGLMTAIILILGRRIDLFLRERGNAGAA